MKEYIEREAVVNTLKLLYCRDCEGHEKYGDISCRACRTGDTLAMVEDFLAADVVKVTRCKDCKWLETTDWDGDEMYYCTNRSGLQDVGRRTYCIYGLRKDEA